MMANNSGELKVGQLVEAGVPFSIADALTTHHRDNGPVTDIHSCGARPSNFGQQRMRRGPSRLCAA